MKKVKIKECFKFNNFNQFNYISAAASKPVAVSSLPLRVELEDTEGNKAIADLIHYLPLGIGPIPSVISYLLSGITPGELKIHLESIGINTNKPLAVYTYKHQQHVL